MTSGCPLASSWLWRALAHFGKPPRRCSQPEDSGAAEAEAHPNRAPKAAAEEVVLQEASGSGGGGNASGTANSGGGAKRDGMPGLGAHIKDFLRHFEPSDGEETDEEGAISDADAPLPTSFQARHFACIARVLVTRLGAVPSICSPAPYTIRLMDFSNLLSSQENAGLLPLWSVACCA